MFLNQLPMGIGDITLSPIFNFTTKKPTFIRLDQNPTSCLQKYQYSYKCIFQVCSDPNSYTLDNTLDSTIAANAKAVVGTSCVTKATAPDTTSTADYIEIACK